MNTVVSTPKVGAECREARPVADPKIELALTCGGEILVSVAFLRVNGQSPAVEATASAGGFAGDTTRLLREGGDHA
jgi:hypothetical protein